MRLKFWKKDKTQKRKFEAAELEDRIVGLWKSFNIDYNSELSGSIARIRDRARDLCHNNDYAARYLSILQTEVIGEKGIQLNSNVKVGSEQQRKELNDDIEAHWKRWGEKGSCEITGKYSFVEFQKIVMSSLARDGEVIIKKIRGADNNPYSYSLQLLDPWCLDEHYHQEFVSRSNKNRVVMGIEIDEYSRPVAYWLKHKIIGTSGQEFEYRRYDRKDIIHLFRSKRPDAIREVSWLAPSARRLKMLKAYEEAETTAARVAASKAFAIIEKDLVTSTGYGGETKRKKMNPQLEMKPGQGLKLPAGMDIKMLDPTHPQGNFSAFVTKQLQAVAAGWNLSYHTLTGDLSEANFASSRQGSLAERDEWRGIQGFLKDSMMLEIYRDWLSMAVLTRAQTGFKLTASRAIFADTPLWIPKSYPWIDPLKDIRAEILAEKAGITSKSIICSQRGHDFNDVCDQRARERKKLEGAGLIEDEKRQPEGQTTQ
ncbi:MAG: phage portal protein [Pseudobacteriovorax sp.]|nr:phage portal protein [Pseudobacteriovorax sp.]